MKDLAIYCILTIFTGLLIGGIIEKQLHRKRLNRIPIRILVNGTRGKTSVTRLLAAALREAGIRTWAKTTGSQAVWILPDGNELEYRKKRPVSIREQIPFVRHASKDGANAIVVECMALHPENQSAMAEELIRPGIVVITNTRVDHIEEIGATEDETASTLTLSVPGDAKLISDADRLDQFRKGRIPALNLKVDREYIDSFEYPVFEDNIRLVLKTCELLGIDQKTALTGMKKARPDPGMIGPFQEGKCLIINGFAANDRDSAMLIYKNDSERYRMQNVPVHIIFNNRSDREFRIGEFLPLIRELNTGFITVIGENRDKAARYFLRKTGISTETAEDLRTYICQIAQKECIVFCLGNIKGQGMEFINMLLERKGTA